MNPVIIVPVYNHPDTVEQVVGDVVSQDYMCVIVDDGSTDETGRIVDDLAEQYDRTNVLHRAENGGKGCAVRDGLQWAREEGYTHAVTIDADAQHDPGDIPSFLSVARSHPDSLILGDPEFDDSIPPARRYGRILSQVWVWIETLSTSIHDPLCGFRCYPIDRTLEIMEREFVGKRMDFDPEIAVRFYWNWGTVQNVRTRITYFSGGVSHFDMLSDNLRISWMHFRLFLGSFLRYPRLMTRGLSSS